MWKARTGAAGIESLPGRPPAVSPQIRGKSRNRDRLPAWLCLAVSVWTLSTLRATAADLPLMEVSIGVHRIAAELANRPDTRARGLMFRQSLPPNQGMLFVFPDNAIHCMWMRNTLVPLSVAFLDDTGSILNIEDMRPQTEDSHCARSPARYALETNVGWFASRGIKPGSRVLGLEKLPR